VRLVLPLIATASARSDDIAQVAKSIEFRFCGRARRTVAKMFSLRLHPAREAETKPGDGFRPEEDDLISG
jgi:hypothetical protein